MSQEEAALALKRFGLGPRPGDIERIAVDPKAAVLAELDAADITRLDDDRLPSTPDAFVAIRHDQVARSAARKTADMPAKGTAPAAAAAAMKSAPPPAAPAMMAAGGHGGMAAGAAAAGMAAGAPPKPPAGPQNRSMVIYLDEIDARVPRQLAAEIGYVERLVAFWTNHFAVQSDKNEQIRGLAGAFEREAIRPHVLGRFEDMLVAATRHPAMLLSLDNVDSAGPHSPAGQKRHMGLNENHAREILELHTVGVDGGYTQADVTEFSRMLTGWTFARDVDKPAAGTFVFKADWHEPGDRRLMGKAYPVPGGKQPADQQGLAALHDLAVHPDTARHVATKLVRHFVADSPPPAIVDAVAATFTATGGDLKAVSRVLVENDASWAGERKFLTPQLFLVASMRAYGVPIEGKRLVSLLRELGQEPWCPPSPEGYHDDAASWLSPDGLTTRLAIADSIAQRVRFDDGPAAIATQLFGPSLSDDTRRTMERAESGRQAAALLLMSPEFQWSRT